MTIAEKIERSKVSQKIDFSKIRCQNSDDPLVNVAPTEALIVNPIWGVRGDIEGKIYKDYLASHPHYQHVYLRSEVHHRLQLAAKSLDPRYKLVIRAGHRPLEVQEKVLDAFIEKYKSTHHAVSDLEALNHARAFVSDPQILLPPHCCGAAVDVELFDMTEDKLVDFGSRINLDEKISSLYYDDINSQQKSNRMLLLEVMLNAGFACNESEWWHYSYGDQKWAWFYNEDASLYNLIEPDKSKLL